MKSFKQYLAENTKDHVYVIKFAHKPSDEQVEIIENWLKRYDVRSIERPALVEYAHKDFIDIEDRDVHRMKIVLGMPVSQYMLLQDLRGVAKIAEKMMVVRSVNEPIQQYARHDSWTRKEDAAAKEAGMVPGPLLSTDQNYSPIEQPPVADLFGNEYNKKLLAYLAGVEKDRPNMAVEDTNGPLFGWLTAEPSEDFNKGFDTPKPTHEGSKQEPVDPLYTNSHGTMSDNAIPSVKVYKDPKTGKTKQVLQPVEKN